MLSQFALKSKNTSYIPLEDCSSGKHDSDLACSSSREQVEIYSQLDTRVASLDFHFFQIFRGTFLAILVTWHAIIQGKSKMSQPIRGQSGQSWFLILSERIQHFSRTTRETFVISLVTGHAMFLPKTEM